MEIPVDWSKWVDDVELEQDNERVCMRMVLRKAAIVTVAAALLCSGATTADEAKPRGSKLFYRLVGSKNNAPILPKTRSVWTQDRRVEMGTTGMADEGYTEYPFCYGLMDFGFVEKYAIYPRLVSAAQADETIVNTADMVIDHVYQPDGCVWGVSGREFAQTFTASKRELISVTLLVASRPQVFRVALLEGGPAGRQIGPTKTMYSGDSIQWGTARWTAGQAPLVPGKTYAIKISSQDGRSWMPYLHSTGNAYDGGQLYVDGAVRPQSDMALWIVEEPNDLRRGLVPDADEDDWVYNADSLWFVPRTPNIKMLWLNVSPLLMEPPTKHNCCDLVIRVWDEQGKLVGGPKRALSCGPKNGPHEAPFLFASDELPVVAGKRYRLDVFAVPHKARLPEPEDVRLIQPADFNLRVYGEPQPGALPAIFNLKADFPENDKLHLTWSQNFAALTRVVIRGDGMKGAGHKTQHVDLNKNTTEALISVWPGHTYEFELTATGPTGLLWRTPTYQVRAPRKTEIEAIYQAPPPYPRQFVNLAPPRVATGRDFGPIRYSQSAPLQSGDFEQGLTGWKAAPAGILNAHNVGAAGQSLAKKNGIGTRWGDYVAGFAHAAGEKREQVFEKSALSQSIRTRPGHVYLLTAMIRTHIKNGSAVDRNLRGDTRVRLFADPAGGGDFEGVNATQWFWTDNEWRRFEHRWTAAADTSMIGLAFFRWRDLDFAGAFADHINVYDLGPAPVASDAAPPRTRQALTTVLVDHRVEAEDKVEAHLSAPPGYVVTGLGSRAHYDNITTMWMKIQPILPDGSLGEASQLRTGWEPDAQLEARVELPPGYVATGFGAGIAPEWDVKRFGVWARLLSKDGNLGDEKLFRGGVDLKSGFEKTVRLEAGRVLTSAGLNCMLNDVNGIRAMSAKLTRTAEAQAKSK